MLTTSKSNPKNKFTYAEDRKLRKFVRLFGEDWKTIASKMLVKNARQCKDRWEKYLSPSISHNPFTLEEDIMILQYYNKIGPKWMQISRFISGRTDILVKMRYRYLTRHGITLESLIASKETEEETEQKTPQIISNEFTVDPIKFDFFDSAEDWL